MINAIIDLRDGGDWSLDLCFAGLIKNIGYQNVVDIPWKKKHREWDRSIADWGMERRTLGYTEDNSKIIEMGDEERLALIREGKFQRVWLDERMESFQKYRELGFYDANVPAVVVAGHDRFWNQSPMFVAQLYGKRLEAMLLDNWYPEFAKLPFRAKRIGWSCNFDHYWERLEPAPAKDIDICFIGYNSHPDRAEIVDHIAARWPFLQTHIYLERRPNCFEEFMSKQDLFHLMQRSKICLNLRGAADRGKTLRAYEIPYVGSFMLSQRIDDPGMMADFVEGKHCSYFESDIELDDAIKRALYDEDWREAIAAEGHNRALKDLNVGQRWADILRWLER